MVSEELKIIIRAEAKAAIDEMGKFKKATGDTSNEMMKFAKQLLGPLGVGYAVREVVRFMKDSVAAYYQATGEVNKFAEANKNLKIAIGDMIVNDPIISWLGDIVLKASEGARALATLRTALQGISINTASTIEVQVASLRKQLADTKTSMVTAEGLLAYALSPQGNAASARKHREELALLQAQKVSLAEALLYAETDLLVEQRKAAVAKDAEERKKQFQSEYWATEEGKLLAIQEKIKRYEKEYSDDWMSRTVLASLYAQLSMLTIGKPNFSTGGNRNFGVEAGVNAAEADINQNGVPWLRGYRPDFSTGGNRNYGVEAEVDAATADILKNGVPWLNDGAKAIAEIQKTMGEMAGEGAVREVAGIFRSMGEAMVGAKDGAEFLTDALAGIANMVSEVFLWGALAAFKADNVYLGTAYLIAAGLFGMVGGAFGSVPSSSSVSRGRSASGKGNVYGLGENIQNPTGTVVVQNISGSVWQTDQLQALSANAARGLNSGR